jgi:hypothetical protein
MTKKAFNIIISLLILLPVAIYFAAWDYYAINIPKWDDHPLKLFIFQYTHTLDPSAKIAALFRQHNEHRIVLTRLVTLLDFKLFGALDYRHLMLVGNLLLVAAIPLWHIILKNNKKPLFALLPIPFLWLTLALSENMYWGMAAVQNFGVVTISLWALYLSVTPQKSTFALSLFLVVLGVFTSPNGIIILPVGAVLLFLLGNRQRLALWILIGAGAVFYYFRDYKQPESNPDAKATFIQWGKGYMAFLGSFAESFPVLDHFKVCIFMGVFLFLVAVSIVSATLFKILRNKYASKPEKIIDLFCLGTILFVLGTSLLVVYSRAGFGLEGLVASKYKIYSILLLITAYLYVVIPIRGSFLSPYITAITFLAITFNVFSYHYHLVDAYNLRKYLTTSQFNWTYKTKDLKPPHDTSFVANIVAKTPVFYENWLPLIRLADRQGFAGDTRALTELATETRITAYKGAFTIRNTSFVSQRLQDSGIYFLLSSKDRFYVFPAYRSRNKNRKELFLKQYYFEPGFYTDVSYQESELPEGEYKVGIIRQQGEKTGILSNIGSIMVTETRSNAKKVNW